MTDVPTLAALRGAGAQIASNLATAKMSGSGDNPQLVKPQKAQNLSYF
jgi:hypothetical protein